MTPEAQLEVAQKLLEETKAELEKIKNDRTSIFSLFEELYNSLMALKYGMIPNSHAVILDADVQPLAMKRYQDALRRAQGFFMTRSKA